MTTINLDRKLVENAHRLLVRLGDFIGNDDGRCDVVLALSLALELPLRCRWCKLRMRHIEMDTLVPEFEAEDGSVSCREDPHARGGTANHAPDVDSVRAMLAGMSNPHECGDERCPGWRIDQVDGDPSPPLKHGDLIIARCDECTSNLGLLDDDVEQLPEAREALLFCCARAVVRRGTP